MSLHKVYRLTKLAIRESVGKGNWGILKYKYVNMQRYVGWRDDDQLKESLKEYVRAEYQRTEILSFVLRDFP